MRFGLMRREAVNLRVLQNPTPGSQEAWLRSGEHRFCRSLLPACAMPNARLVTFENSAHMPAIEEVDAFNAALLGFARVVMPARKVA